MLQVPLITEDCANLSPRVASGRSSGQTLSRFGTAPLASQPPVLSPTVEMLTAPPFRTPCRPPVIYWSRRDLSRRNEVPARPILPQGRAPESLETTASYGASHEKSGLGCCTSACRTCPWSCFRPACGRVRLHPPGPTGRRCRLRRACPHPPEASARHRRRHSPLE